MTRGRKPLKTDDEQIVKLYTKGVRVTDIAKQFSISTHTVEARLMTAGINARQIRQHRSILKKMQKRVRGCLSPYKKFNMPTNARVMQRYYSEPKFRLTKLLRSRMRHALMGVAKEDSAVSLLGCTTEQFKRHLESQFTRRMNWQNQGQWHVDHIIPCSAFDMTDPNQQRACFHYTNLRPLWGTANRIKHVKIEMPQLSLLI